MCIEMVVVTVTKDIYEDSEPSGTYRTVRFRQTCDEEKYLYLESWIEYLHHIHDDFRNEATLVLETSGIHTMVYTEIPFLLWYALESYDRIHMKTIDIEKTEDRKVTEINEYDMAISELPEEFQLVYTDLKIRMKEKISEYLNELRTKAQRVVEEKKIEEYEAQIQKNIEKIHERYEVLIELLEKRTHEMMDRIACEYEKRLNDYFRELNEKIEQKIREETKSELEKLKEKIERKTKSMVMSMKNLAEKGIGKVRSIFGKKKDTKEEIREDRTEQRGMDI